MGSSYQYTCENISIDGDVISATCQRRDGSWNETSLSLRGIENIDGILEVTDPYARSSFQLSAMNISIDGDVLSATCRRMDGLWNESSLVLDGIENIDGNLEYTGSP
ncbi:MULTISPECIES: CVNH domain-containing protein [unclassified Tolypothrix]|uniref:mannose-binding lectin n=1 Tax=unclassified Tolypothrix TaxID=2649714 RepID=UPI0005EAACAF|nr:MULTISPECIES: CVNH domain-containing protein [unclassified Tolypothrix]BAY90358.1 Cyanovirin-N domain protein [Microchaete diplosiphon NIES-3275]EKE98823.1 putative cyanovirin-N domain protein [Tolypothrix sp. PCC 7601]MBE9083407.1 CVNH domain-containing protein [Tolypothrix sp. LEGE 11397]UYD24537.1 CVNH domain-containing protein [Tolypothrix sp. PCC 7712]UYD33234.1 CVNH domain-containing protein [Tolypothrix sp. PCC 7601]